MQQEWRREVPYEVWKRFDESIGRNEISFKDVIIETRYLISVIVDGGSWYDDDPEEERVKLVNECRLFLNKYKKNGRNNRK